MPVNPDIDKERKNSTIDLDKMKQYLGEYILLNKENYHSMLKYSKPFRISIV